MTSTGIRRMAEVGNLKDSEVELKCFTSEHVATCDGLEECNVHDFMFK